MKLLTVAVAALSLAACRPAPMAGGGELSTAATQARSVSAAAPLRHVVKVHDGDTLNTLEDGAVRLLGYDAPEIGHRGRCPREKAMAIEARDHVRERTRDGVELRRAVDDRGRKQRDRDRYNRLLRAGFAADGGDIAAELVGRGLAVPYWGRGARKDWCKPGATK